MTYQRMDGELPELRARFTFIRPEPDQLRLAGTVDDRAVTVSLHRVDLNSYTLRNRGFHWVQEYPYFT